HRVRGAVGVLAHQPNRRPGHGVEVERPAFGGAHAREVEELRQEARQPIALAHHEGGEELLVRVGALGAPQLLHRRADRRERVLDLVRQARRQLGDRFQPLGAQVQLLQPLRIRDVGEDRRHPGLGSLHLECRRRHADREGAIGTPHHRLDPHGPPSAPLTDTRLAKYAVTAATPTKTSSCSATCPVMGVRWPKNTSAKYTMPTSAVISPVLAGGISTAVTAIKGTYKGVRSLCGPPVMWTT